MYITIQKFVIILFLFLGLIFIYSCQTRNQINSSSIESYKESIHHITTEFSKEEISEFEINILIVMLGSYFIEKDPSQTVSLLSELGTRAELNLIKKLNSKTYTQIKNEAKIIEDKYYEKNKDRVLALEDEKTSLYENDIKQMSRTVDTIVRSTDIKDILGIIWLQLKLQKSELLIMN